MKLLQNPWVTGALVVMAAAVVCFQFLPANRGHAGAPAARLQPSPVVSAPTPVPQPPPAKAASQPMPGPLSEILPQKSIDSLDAKSRFAGWVNAPQHDPFLALNEPVRGNPGSAGTNSPVASWRLNAIWRQAGGQLAVINNQIYKEGDLIKGYKIMKIERDQVWLQGSNRVEILGFKVTDASPQPGSQIRIQTPTRLPAPTEKQSSERPGQPHKGSDTPANLAPSSENTNETHL